MERLAEARSGFGTLPVFLTSISTILGAILFLRFDYAVGHVGFFGTIAIILIGHLVTMPTALAIAEIATNQKVEGGGMYYIISRSFGINIGAAIGLALFLSQAISVAFYIIAFAEAFQMPMLRPMYVFIWNETGLDLSDPRFISIPAMLLLTGLILTRGANVGMKALYFVAGILLLSLVLFFLGDTGYKPGSGYLTRTISKPDSFFYVFAICFPAFTGMAAGVGLSGDLKDPKKSIPIGTISATLIGMLIYAAVAYKLSASANPWNLASGEMIMSKIALWGPIIPIGLICAALSSALGSVIVAPRTLQALGNDGIFQNKFLNGWVAKGRENDGEPINGAVITCIIAMLFVVMGNVNFVAEIISMFFMVSYGAICTISFLEHFAADPSYRPAFKSRWYFSLLGALMCIYLMFKMNPIYALLSLVLMIIMYLTVSMGSKEKKGMAAIFQGAIYQLSRQLQVFLQKNSAESNEGYWRPSVVCVSRYSFERLAAFDMMRWISYRYGFGTYVHYLEDYLSSNSNQKALDAKHRLLSLTAATQSNVFVDTLISPSYTSAIAQIIQLPGISGQDNNMLMFEFLKTNPDNLADMVDNYQMIKSVGFDVVVLGSSDKGFGLKQAIHVWITHTDYDNANLMILLAYITLGHPDWKNGYIKIFALFPQAELEDQKEKLLSMMESGRLPISKHNIEVIAHKDDMDDKMLVAEKSRDADLCIVGYRNELLKHKGIDTFLGYDGIGNVLFVNASTEKVIK